MISLQKHKRTICTKRDNNKEKYMHFLKNIQKLFSLTVKAFSNNHVARTIASSI